MGDKMTSMVEAMVMYTRKKKKRGPGKVRDEGKIGKNREKLIKSLLERGIGPSCALIAIGKT